mmetsp:Transcript_63335/g.174192  ORF Transcript_63335/g.174192 Transcript_63335/m.174192 type:complete len:226 (+) Transcript_63335:190-867(+)
MPDGEGRAFWNYRRPAPNNSASRWQVARARQPRLYPCHATSKRPRVAAVSEPEMVLIVLTVDCVVARVAAHSMQGRFLPSPALVICLQLRLVRVYTLRVLLESFAVVNVELFVAELVVARHRFRHLELPVLVVVDAMFDVVDCVEADTHELSLKLAQHAPGVGPLLVRLGARNEHIDDRQGRPHYGFSYDVPEVFAFLNASNDLPLESVPMWRPVVEPVRHLNVP